MITIERASGSLCGEHYIFLDGKNIGMTNRDRVHLNTSLTGEQLMMVGRALAHATPELIRIADECRDNGYERIYP